MKQLTELLSNVGVGIWEWNLATDKVIYSPTWAQIVGYSVEELPQVADTWEKMVLPEDLEFAKEQIVRHVSGEDELYEASFRMVCKDGNIIWAQDKGRVLEYDKEGNAVQFVGVLQDVTKLKTAELRLMENQETMKQSEEQLKEALATLANNNLYLETQMESRNREILEQDKMLMTVNQISRKLLVFQPGENFVSLVQECLCLLGESIHKNRVYIWKDRTDNKGRVYCTQAYEWVRNAEPIQGKEEYEEIPYDMLPAFWDAMAKDQCLNSLLRDLSDHEKEVLSPQGIKTILIAPMVINGKQWGFIGVDNCEEEQLFTEIETNMLLMSGTMLCNTIEKMETDAALREMEERTQIMLNATPLCCNLWTSEHENMSCNEEAVRLFELSSQAEYLERFQELSPEYQPGGMRSEDMSDRCIRKAFQEGYYRFEWLHQKTDGTPIPAEITLVRIKYKDGFMVAGYTRDLREQKAMISELQSKENDLRTARDEALLNSKAKSNFLANMSHEIRTPMNAISGLAEIILRESTNDKTMGYAKGIKDACGSLMNIINDILDISKIESGKLEVFNSPYELASLINDVITISQVRLGDKPLMFTANIDSHLPARLVGDELRIKQILINILSNAIKFTPNGNIALRISGIMNGDKATLQISVKDSGVGIQEEDLQRLFVEFERVNTTKNRSIEGTGLGLAISKRLCEMMNGRIEVESTYGQGSEFRIIIPQECPIYERLSHVEEKKRVLLYEPRDPYRASIAETLENLDCTCVSCANQSELYDNIHNRSYAYIMTPALHLKKIKGLVERNHMSVEVVAFADYGERMNDDKVYTIHFPVTCLQLADLLNGDLDHGKYFEGSKAIAKFVAPNARVLVVDDNSINLQVAKGLLEPYQFMVETAQDGLEAVEKVRNKKYDLVFMDHMMPVMDGIDATVAIRNLKGTYYQELPIVALTANALVGTREMFIQEGMNDLLAKPIELNKLAHILIKWIPKSKLVMSSSKALPEKVETVQGWTIEGVNTIQGILSIGGSKENYINVLAAYHADGKHKLLSLLQHLADDNLSLFRTEVHALKSTSATIGALEVSAMAAKLEDAAKINDLKYIDDNFGDFLTEFQEVLEAIAPILVQEQMSLQKRCLAEEKEAGEWEYLNEMLGVLHDAADFANISQIEESLKKLQEFLWAEEITGELLNMQKYLNVFDYDGILECVLRLKV